MCDINSFIGNYCTGFSPVCQKKNCSHFSPRWPCQKCNVRTVQYMYIHNCTMMTHPCGWVWRASPSSPCSRSGRSWRGRTRSHSCPNSTCADHLWSPASQQTVRKRDIIELLGEIRVVLVKTICALQHLSKLRERSELLGEIGKVLVQTICALQHLSKLREIDWSY